MSDERDIPVVEQGSGVSMLVVHGGSGDLTAWAGVATRLADRFHVVRYTRPTYRLDPPPRGADAAGAEVRDLLAVADSITGPLFLVGHSSGAIAALQALLAAPTRFAGAVLYEPPLSVTEPIGGEALVRARAALDAGQVDEAMTIHLRDIVRLPPAVLQGLREPAAWKHIRRWTAGQIADNEALESLPVGLARYSTIDTPVLLIGGTASPEHLRQRLAALAAVLPRVDSVVLLPDQSHSAQLTAPDLLAEAIGAFADRTLKAG